MKLKASIVALVAAAFGVAAQAGVNWVNTLTQPINTKASNGVAGRAAEITSPAQMMHITVSLRLRNKQKLDERVASIMQGHASMYLTPAQFMANHAPTVAQAQAVANYLRNQGLRNVTIASNNLLVSGDAMSGQVAAAFNTEIHNFYFDGTQHYAAVKVAQVPALLSGIVLSVHGLQNVATPQLMLRHASVRRAPDVSNNVIAHQPTDFPHIYDAASLPPAGNATVATISWGNMSQVLTDISTFETKAGIAPVNVSVVNVGTPGSANGIDEWDLDGQNIIAASGGQLKQLIFYAANSNLTEAFNQALTDHVASVVNVSLGGCETAWKQDGEMAADDQIFESAVAEGMVFSVASGDGDARLCGSKTEGQSYPAVSPYVVAVGGTTLYTAGNTTYASESAWAEGGGGPSVTEAAPSWQIKSGVIGSSKFRAIPDISFDADPYTGALVIVDSQQKQIGGTGLSAALFAGFWARIQSENGNARAYPNSAVYANAPSNPTAFHDVTSGNNGGVSGYSAGPGWDNATGWGSLDVAKFATLIASNSVGSGGGSSGITAFNPSSAYVNGSIVSSNGTTYVMTDLYMGQPVTNYRVPGSACAPTTCTASTPFQWGNSWEAYWTRQ
jgi:pseudomonalisin/xanthomonalisin